MSSAIGMEGIYSGMATLKGDGRGEQNKLMSSIAMSMAQSQATADSVPRDSNPIGREDDDDDFLAQWEQKRIEELKRERDDLIRQNDRPITGDYREIMQDEFLPEVTSHKLVICHFYHQEFQRCRVIDQHLQQISQTHPETKFLRINAEKAPFFVARLAVKVLPTVVIFLNGVAVDRIVGFEGISTEDNFPTMALTRRLVKSGGIIAANRAERGPQLHRGSSSSSSSDSDS